MKSCTGFVSHNVLYLYCGQIRIIDRNCEIPHEGPFCDLMWSDPEEIETWTVSPRGAGWLFGSRVTQEVQKQIDFPLFSFTFALFISFNLLICWGFPQCSSTILTKLS
jgi:hypothetical protein